MSSLQKNQPWSSGQYSMAGCLEKRASLASAASSESLSIMTTVPVRMR